jgi:1-phosphatidylinositol phosphodiesterase
VRFLDIRCRQTADVFDIYHGRANQHLTYAEGVQQVCLDFLAAHPSETIVMSVKKEGDGGDNALSFEQVFRGYIERANSADRWVLADTVPALGEARGKIVLFRRFDADARGTVLGLNPLPWPDNVVFVAEGVANFRVQDEFRVPTVTGRPRKWELVNAMLDEAKDGGRTLYVNFCSATGLGSTPRAMADEINPRLMSYLAAHPRGRFGAVLIDFETAEITRRIFETNF